MTSNYWAPSSSAHTLVVCSWAVSTYPIWAQLCGFILCGIWQVMCVILGLLLGDLPWTPSPCLCRRGLPFPISQSSWQPSALWFGVFYWSNSSMSVLQFPALKFYDSLWNSSLKNGNMLQSLYAEINVFTSKIILSTITFLVTHRHARSFNDLVIIMHINFHCMRLLRHFDDRSWLHISASVWWVGLRVVG